MRAEEAIAISGIAVTMIDNILFEIKRQQAGVALYIEGERMGKYAYINEAESVIGKMLSKHNYHGWSLPAKKRRIK